MARFFPWLVMISLFWPGWLAAVEVVDGPHVELAGTAATIRWKLDGAAGGTVRFGEQADRLGRSAKSPGVATEHSVRLESLVPGTRYFFSVGTARRVLKTGVFDVGGADGMTKAGPRGALPESPGTARGGVTPRLPPSAVPDDSVAPPARRTWANVATLRDHFDRHGGDFDATSGEDYAAQAWRFLQRAKREGLPAKLDPEGTLRVWDPRTQAFAAYSRQGLTKTYFKPQSRGYFDRQPGRRVTLKPESAPSTR